MSPDGRPPPRARREGEPERRLTPGQAARLAPWLGPLRAVRARGKDANGKGVRR